MTIDCRRQDKFVLPVITLNPQGLRVQSQGPPDKTHPPIPERVVEIQAFSSDHLVVRQLPPVVDGALEPAICPRFE